MGADGAVLLIPSTVEGQGEMICAFAVAVRLGGAFGAALGARLEFLLTRARRGDGLFVHALGPDGAVLEEAARPRDQASMGRALVLGGTALGWGEVAAMGADPRLRAGGEVAREGTLAAHARAVVEAMARWRRLGAVADARAALDGVAGLGAALAGALPGLWRGENGAVAGSDLRCFARAAAALNGEDRIWCCP